MSAQPVLNMINELIDHTTVLQRKYRGREARDAVAEYIAANDEYDAAWVAMCYDQGTETEARFSAAKARRAAAHARMKGETK